MKPAPFEYHRMTTVSQVTSCLAQLGDEARILAGGQSLVPMMNFRIAQPTHLVDINDVRELSYIRAANGHVRVGAVVRQAAVERSDEIRRLVPLVAEGLGLVAHPPIRNRGTVVGSIAHADPASEMPAVAVALKARITLASTSGERTVPAEDFFVGPFETAIGDTEVVTEVAYPIIGAGVGTGISEFARRHGDFAIAGAVARLELSDDQRVRDASVVLFGVGPRPHRALRAEECLIGESPDEATIGQAADLALHGLAPSGDVHGGTEYRVRIARAQARKALTLAVGRAAKRERT